MCMYQCTSICSTHSGIYTFHYVCLTHCSCDAFVCIYVCMNVYYNIYIIYMQVGTSKYVGTQVGWKVQVCVHVLVCLCMQICTQVKNMVSGFYQRVKYVYQTHAHIQTCSFTTYTHLLVHMFTQKTFRCEPPEGMATCEAKGFQRCIGKWRG